MLHGSCACGQITFAVDGQPDEGLVCHCTQCRKMSGHAWASAELPRAALKISGPIKWIQLSDKARRGICPNCGSFLFWDPSEGSEIGFALGAVDGATGVTRLTHIFTQEQGDYRTLPAVDRA